MPTLDELEEARKRNLAAADAAIAARNAVFSRDTPFDSFARVAQYQEPGTAAITTFPGGGTIDYNAGTVTGNVPIFRRAAPVDTGISDAMDRADLGGRFGFGSPQYRQGTENPAAPQQDNGGIDIAAVNARRNQILSGIDPDAPAININSKRQAELNRELGVLTHVAQEHAFTSAKQAHEGFLNQKHIDTANQVSGFFNDLSASKTTLGTSEHSQEVTGLAAKYPLALGTVGVRDALKTHLAQHVAASNFVAPEGYVVDHVVTDSTGKGHAVFKPASKNDKSKDNELLNLYGLHPENLTNAQSVRSIGEAKVGAVGANQGKFVEVQTVVKGKPTTAVLPKADYLRFGGKLAPSDMPGVQNDSTATTGAGNAPPATTEVIKKNGHSYEVDHASKKVIRQID